MSPQPLDKSAISDEDDVVVGNGINAVWGDDSHSLPDGEAVDTTDVAPVGDICEFSDNDDLALLPAAVIVGFRISVGRTIPLNFIFGKRSALRLTHTLNDDSSASNAVE